MAETRRSQKIRRLERELRALLEKHRITKAAALAVADKVEEIDEVRERMIVWGDEWAKDDHPHARRRECPRSGHFGIINC